MGFEPTTFCMASGPGGLNPGAVLGSRAPVRRRRGPRWREGDTRGFGRIGFDSGNYCPSRRAGGYLAGDVAGGRGDRPALLRGVGAWR
jgi:hypothetical protein